MRMDNFSGLPRFACMIWKGAKTRLPGSAECLSIRSFVGEVLGEALCAAVEDAARERGTQTLYLFTLDKHAWYSRLGWTMLGPCVWHDRSGDIMCKRLQSG